MNYNKDEFKERLSEKERVFFSQTIQKIDSKTGEVLSTFENGYIKKQSKKGWCTMYKKDMKEVLMELANYPTANKVWLELWDYMKKDGTLKPFKQTELAKKLGTQRQVIGRAIKKLKYVEAIEKIDGEWRYNPFIFNVAGMSDLEKHEAQMIWEKEIGYYGK